MYALCASGATNDEMCKVLCGFMCHIIFFFFFFIHTEHIKSYTENESATYYC